MALTRTPRWRWKSARPIGQADDTAVLDLKYVAHTHSSLCANWLVTAVSRPEECSLLEKATANCRKSFTEKVLTPLLSALCVTIPE
jgi:hypothetical protein